jgi:hypothetical protein
VWIPLALGLACLFLATAGFPPRIDPNSRTSILFFIFAAISLLIFGAALLFGSRSRQAVAPVTTATSNALQAQIVGRYRAEGDPNYINTITPLGGELFRIGNRAWDGVGFFDGKTYCGIFKYNQEDKVRSGIWGAHRADLICQKGQWRLLVQGWEMKEGSGLLPWDTHGDWIKED